MFINTLSGILCHPGWLFPSLRLFHISFFTLKHYISHLGSITEAIWEGNSLSATSFGLKFPWYPEPKRLCPARSYTRCMRARGGDAHAPPRSHTHRHRARARVHTRMCRVCTLACGAWGTDASTKCGAAQLYLAQACKCRRWNFRRRASRRSDSLLTI